MVGRADDHHVYILVVDHASPVFVEVGHLLARLLLHVGGSLVEPLVVYVAKGHALHLGIVEEGVQVVKTHAAATDQGHLDLVARSVLPKEGTLCADQRSGTQSAKDQACSLHKTASIHDISRLIVFTYLFMHDF